MSQLTPNAGATPDEVLNALDALGEDPNACRVDAVHARLAGQALPAGDRESAIRQAVDTARHQVDAQGAMLEDNQFASREVLERPQEKSFEVAEIKFSAIRKMKPIPHWLLRTDENGVVFESGAGGISNQSVPKMIASVEELYSRVSKGDVADFRRRFGLPQSGDYTIPPRERETQQKQVMRFTPPQRTSPHFPFYEAIKNGGRVWRNDTLNNVQEWLDLNRLGGDPTEVCRYGYTNLSLVGPSQDLAPERSDPKMMPKRIEALFQPESWTNGAPLDTPAVGIHGARSIDVTRQVLALSLEYIRALENDADSANDLVDAAALGHTGPHRIAVTEQVEAFFGVRELSEISQAQLDAARYTHESTQAKMLESSTIRPAKLYVKAFSSHEFPNASWASVDVTPEFVERILRLRALCVDNDLADVRVDQGPQTWSGADQWKPDLPFLRVSKDDFWFSAVPKNVDCDVQTQVVPIDAMMGLLHQANAGEHDSRCFAWFNGALYCDGSNAELLAETVAEGEPSHEAPSMSM